MGCAFECFQSHCHIFKELYEFLCMMDALNIFGEDSFIFSFVTYRLMTKSLGVGCTFKKVVLETKCRKMNVNPCTTKLGRIISPSFLGPKSIEVTILNNDSKKSSILLKGPLQHAFLWRTLHICYSNSASKNIIKLLKLGISLSPE